MPHDVTCVVHLHSRYSDGTGTVPQIARAGRRAGADVVILTDHNTLAARERGEERWYGAVLLLVGEEVSPTGDRWEVVKRDGCWQLQRLDFNLEPP